MQQKNKIYFVSDFHFGLSDKDTEEAKERKVVAFLQSIEADAKRVVLLGDIFDFWFEYKVTVPKGFVLFQAQIKKMTSQGIIVDYFIGNHDLWQKNYFKDELGVVIHREKYKRFVFDNKTFVIGHGDGLDNKDIGYKIMDAVFSNNFFWFVFALFPACFSIGIARLWSRGNRKKHRQYDNTDMKKEEPMYKFCENYLKTDNADYFVFGHRHIKQEFSLSDNSKYFNTGAWINDSPYVVFNGESLELKTF